MLCLSEVKGQWQIYYSIRISSMAPKTNSSLACFCSQNPTVRKGRKVNANEANLELWDESWEISLNPRSLEARDPWAGLCHWRREGDRQKPDGSVNVDRGRVTKIALSK